MESMNAELWPYIGAILLIFGLILAITALALAKIFEKMMHLPEILFTIGLLLMFIGVIIVCATAITVANPSHKAATAAFFYFSLLISYCILELYGRRNH